MRDACRVAQSKKREINRAREHIATPQNKKCGRCKCEKLAESFGVLRSSSDGLRAYCKPCEVAWAKEKYDRDIEASRIKAMERYFKNVEHHRAVGRAAASVRRSRKVGGGGRHSKSDIQQLLKLQRNCCADCGCSVKDGYHVDHIVPVSRGGSSWPWNLQILCPSCNMQKRAKDPIEHAQKIGRLL